VTEVCWVCRTAIEAGQASFPARCVPHRLRAFEGKAVHLRCQGEWDGVIAPARGGRRVERPGGSLTEGTRLFAEDVAAMRGISPRQARRWLHRLELRFGVAAVGRIDGRRGPRRFTTEAALETIGPRLQSSDGLVHERMAELEARVERLERSHRQGAG
jgi:hypothetical protein